jgi:hypothetical protein
MRVALLRDLPLGVGAISIPLSIGGSGAPVAPQQAAPLGGSSATTQARSAASTSIVPPPNQ